LNELPPAGALRLQLTEAHKLRLHIVSRADPRHPLADAAVTVLDESPEVDRSFRWGYHNIGGKRCYAQADGWATFVDLPDDEALVTVEHPGFARQRLLWHKQKAEIEVQLEPESVVAGTVLLKPGKPLARCYLQLGAGDGDQYATEVAAKDQGRFRFDQLPPGKYTLTVQDERRTLATRELQLQPGKTADVTIKVAEAENRNRAADAPNLSTLFLGGSLAPSGSKDAAVLPDGGSGSPK